MGDASSLRQLISREAWVEALAVALAWWRRTRAPELAALVTWLGERVETPALTPHGMAAETFHAAWCARLQEGAPALRVLLPTLHSKLPGALRTFGPGSEEELAGWQGALLARFEALAAQPADPRIALRFASFITEMEIDHSMAHDAYRIAFEALAQLGDVRTLPGLRRAAAGEGITRDHLRGLFATELPPFLELLEATARDAQPLDATTREALSILMPRAEPTSRAPEVLFAQVLAEPRRIELRHVWADALLERGDPRGEFVALQLKALSRPLPPPDAAREKALQRKHQRTWLGPLADVLLASTVVFKAGCLVEARLAQGPNATPEQWRRLSVEPSLATLERLLRGTSQTAYLLFLASPTTPLLEAAEVNNNGMLARLADSGAAAKVRHLSLERTLNAGTFELLERLPRLETLHLGARVRSGPHREELDQRDLQRVRLIRGEW